MEISKKGNEFLYKGREKEYSKDYRAQNKVKLKEQRGLMWSIWYLDKSSGNGFKCIIIAL